ncbi:cell envelope-related transcriptional attenuator [Firmicutes bacterium CAG:95]|nr:cell envelope-related transcriptional attenuator [Firmicutes bacterium CAG:95]
MNNLLTNKKNRRDRVANLEKSQILDPEKVKRDKKRKRKVVALTVLAAITGLLAAAFAAFLIVGAIGKANLRSNVIAAPKLENAPVVIELQPTEEEAAGWKEGWVKYNGQIYAYNEDILTFLIMGIDKTKDVKEVAEGTNGGQADALFLVVLNPHDNSLSVIGINRNTMTDISVYDDNGAYVNTIKAQITVQHGFGNGVEESCEYQVNAVQHLFYEMPVHGYAAINMSAIGPLTDMVGGVDVVALEDIKSGNSTVIKEGEEVHLEGDLAFAYIHNRDTKEFGSADHRLERQKQFITTYLQKVKQKTKEDIGFPISVYQSIAPQTVTSLTVDEMTYLVSIAKDYSFDENYLYTLKGETKQGDVFEEFYVDETDLFELILKVFYEPVEQ